MMLTVAIVIKIENHGVRHTIAVAVPHHVVDPAVAVEVQRHCVRHAVPVEVDVGRRAPDGGHTDTGAERVLHTSRTPRTVVWFRSLSAPG